VINEKTVENTFVYHELKP